MNKIVVSGVPLCTSGASTQCVCGATAIEVYWGQNGRGSAAVCPACWRWARDTETFRCIVANGRHNGVIFERDFNQLHLCRCGGMGETFKTTGSPTQWEGISCKTCKFTVHEDGWDRVIRKWEYTMEEESRFFEAFGRFFLHIGYRRYRTL